MKSIEQLFEEIVCSNPRFISVDENSDRLRLYIYQDGAFIIGSLYDWDEDFYISTKRVALTGDYEDDLCYLIELLLKDAKVAQTA